MDYHRSIPAWLAVLLLGVQIGRAADDPGGGITVESMAGTRYDALRRDILQERDTQAKQLLQVLGVAKPGSDAQRNAIFLAGELRTPEAVPWLIENLARVKRGALKAHPSVYDLYPCVIALEQIGKPASQAAVSAIAAENDPLRRRLLVHVVQGVEGEVVAALILEREIAAQERQPEAQSRLKKALAEGVHLVGNAPDVSRPLAN